MCRYISRTDHNTIYQFPGLFTNLSNISSSLYISMCFISTKPATTWPFLPCSPSSSICPDGSRWCEQQCQNPAVDTNAWKIKTLCSTNWGANIHQMEMAEQILISCPQEMTSFGKLEMRRCRNQRDWFFQKPFQHQTLQATASSSMHTSRPFVQDT